MAKKPKHRPESPGINLELLPDDTLLAAVDRADRHDPHQFHRSRDGAPLREIAEHLGLRAGGWTSRRLREQLESLATAEVLTVARRDRTLLWASTDTGRERLAFLSPCELDRALPESPQHREWRLAREAAAEHMEELYAQLRRELGDASGLLSRPRCADSDSWFALATRLSRTSMLVGSATHCLYEWREPSDATADIDLYEDPGDEQLTEFERKRRRSRRGGHRQLRRELREDEDLGARIAGS
jgi:hypothetical protein